MKRYFLGVVIFALALAAGCSKESETKNKDEMKLEFLEVSIHTPDKIDLNKEVKIEALVTQGEEEVSDAKDVKFEIWKMNQEKHEMLKATNEGEGKYTIQKTFTENGNYFITAHVTARSLHAMPKKEISVGDSSEATVEKSEEEHHESEHHHGSELSIEFNKESVFRTNVESELSAKILNEGSPLTKADITFELLADGEKPLWIDAQEVESGMYSAKTTFKKSGTYHIQIHVKKGDLHDHKVEMFNVN